MDIVIDSNVLFSALIRDSTTRKIILDYAGTFLIPEHELNELEKYRGELIRKSKMSVMTFNEVLSQIFQKLVIVHREKTAPHAQKAYKIMKDIHLEDIPFIACALAYPNSVIWSDDNHFKKQKEVVSYTTSEILFLLHLS